jgi:hypothetical protein
MARLLVGAAGVTMLLVFGTQIEHAVSGGVLTLIDPHPTTQSTCTKEQAPAPHKKQADASGTTRTDASGHGSCS